MRVLSLLIRQAAAAAGRKKRCDVQQARIERRMHIPCDDDDGGAKLCRANANVLFFLYSIFKATT